MKIKLLFSILFFAGLVCIAQNREESPMSWNTQLNRNVAPIELPPLELEAIIREDSINDLDKSLPWRYGIERPIVFNLNTSGEWSEIPNIGRIWRVAVKSPEAINISINFEDFNLPEGARLQMYNADRSDVSRIFSHAQNSVSSNIGSWYINGDLIYIEYFEPEYVTASASLQIGSIIHGYRLGRVQDLVGGQKGMNDAGACNYDVNCPIGDDFDSKKDIVKKTVALLTLGNGYLCSAALVNNTNQDKTPFLLTANHCLDNSDPSLWTVRFNWMSPSPECATGEPSADLQSNFTMSGSTLLANNELSDFALVVMNNDIPSSWDISFGGWDHTDTNPEFEVGIHHPNGDIMKICRDDSGAVKDNANGTEVWLIGGVSVGSGDGWEIGTTESGSSGSPLFDQNGRIIGQLYAGQSFCDGLENNNDYDIYGRFGVSWNAGVTPETRLRDWLDPINSGQTTLGTLQNILNTQEFDEIGKLEIYPNPASTEITVINSRYPHLSYSLFNLVGQKLMDGSVSNTMNTISVESFAEGVYFLYLVDDESKSSITKKIVVER
ncbi:T9SS type A sorting domain-containing protein [Ulvibacter antarcticus]|uniref:Putative secreted protein (Por secretion system target) n=1 Tax=Ulvibacter antarcticus TaxID=442714 RepID=A0A3L9Y9Z2_9FLAO|nr:T9SS type A sorting domain-containing protein [Ulvibacter antarcticus]RMA57194.1 putative secreted protein (Por secretion system target) [Ulvibacter antarcticus]